MAVRGPTRSASSTQRVSRDTFAVLRLFRVDEASGHIGLAPSASTCPIGTSQVRPRCMRRLPERPFLAGETAPLPCKGRGGHDGCVRLARGVVRRGEPEVSAGGPQEG